MEAEEKAMAAETLYQEGRLSANQIAKRLGIAKSTLQTPPNYVVAPNPAGR